MSAPIFSVVVIDDDEAFADSMKHLLEAHGFDAHVFRSAEAFVDKRDSVPRPSIALLDVRMPGKSGFHLLSELAGDPLITVVMMTGHGDVPLAVRAIQKGAQEFIEKPFSEKKLLAALSVATEELERRLSAWNNEKAQAEKLAQLTPRENDVLQLIAEGCNSKQIAEQLEVSVRTVEMHRANVVRRLKLQNMTQALALYLARGEAK